ncbi:MAG: winged helix-turn-helix transcriptional regulator [bacterium]
MVHFSRNQALKKGKNPPTVHTTDPASPPRVMGMIESIVGCKWSLQVLALIRRDIRRPGAMVRACPGLTTKVLNERLRKMQRFGILQKKAYPEIPPRVEYQLTGIGRRFVAILDEIKKLQREIGEE